MVRFIADRRDPRGALHAWTAASLPARRPHCAGSSGVASRVSHAQFMSETLTPRRRMAVRAVTPLPGVSLSPYMCVPHAWQQTSLQVKRGPRLTAQLGEATAAP